MQSDEIVVRTIERTKVGDRFKKENGLYEVTEVHSHYVRCVNLTKSNGAIEYYYEYPYYECFTLGDLVMMGMERTGYVPRIDEVLAEVKEVA